MGPPAWYHLRNVPIGLAHPNAPVGKPSIGFALPAANPESHEFSKQLDLQGSIYWKRAQWWCNSEPTEDWRTKKRESSGITAPSTLQLANIDFDQIFRRSTTRISLIGSSSPPLSVLRKHTANPAVHLWIDQPPIGVRYGLFQNDEIEWLGPQGPLDACMIWINKNNTFGGLFRTAEELKSSQCKDGLFIALGDPKRKPYQWTVPFACPLSQMK